MVNFQTLVIEMVNLIATTYFFIYLGNVTGKLNAFLNIDCDESHKYK